MNLNPLTRAIRRIGHRLGLAANWEQSSSSLNGTEHPAEWYNGFYENSQSHKVPYQHSCYYSLWAVIADRLIRSGIKRILEIGCGPGRLAALLRDQGVEDYVGLDFSSVAVEIAKESVVEFRFEVGDARTSDIYKRVEYEAIISTEVLEHIEDDLLVVSRFGVGKRCLCTVPNFPEKTHVRVFENAGEVRTRYESFFQHLDVMTLKSPNHRDHSYFLFDGMRNAKVIKDAKVL